MPPSTSLHLSPSLFCSDCPRDSSHPSVRARVWTRLRHLPRSSRSASRKQDAARLAIASSLPNCEGARGGEAKATALPNFTHTDVDLLLLVSLSPSLLLQQQQQLLSHLLQLTMVSKEATASTAAITFGKKRATTVFLSVLFFPPRSLAYLKKKKNFNSSWRRHRVAPQPLRPREHRQGLQEVQGCFVRNDLSFSR